MALLVPESAERVLVKGDPEVLANAWRGIGAEIIDNDNFISPNQ